MVGEEPQLPVDASPPKLIVAIAGGSSQTHTLTRPNSDDRPVEDNDIVISSQIVSRQHARLERVNGGYKLVVAAEAENPVSLKAGHWMVHAFCVMVIRSE